MDDGPLPGTRSRDESSYSYDLSNAIYGVLPSRATDVSPRRSCASSPARKKSSKRQSPADLLGISHRSISVGLNASAPTWLPPSERRTRLLHDQRMELHQTTCLNLNMASDNSTESDLWILPDFDDWELETEQQDSIKQDNEWAPLLHRAAKSNLERLRARLEGDGWAFVGGKYDEEKKALQAAANQSEESIDPEFDVVVLPVMRVSC